MKAERNKTIDMTVEAGQEYLDRCLDFRGRGTRKTAAKAMLSLSELVDKTIMGDSLEVIKRLPEKSVDLLIVDPPYNLNKNFSGNRFKKLSSEDYYKYTKAWLEAVLPLLKESASVYVCCDWLSSGPIARALSECLIVRNRITWQREKGRGAKANWKNGMEDIWFATVSGTYTFNLEAVKIRRKVIAPYKQDGAPKDWQETPEGRFRDTCPSNFWDDISIPYWSMPENTAHPTQKPEKLLAKLILASSNKGDLVLDPFVGSGSTSVAAKKLGRHYIGIEQNPQYCVWAEKRLENAERDKSIQGYEDGVFWERNTGKEQKKRRKTDEK